MKPIDPGEWWSRITLGGKKMQNPRISGEYVAATVGNEKRCVAHLRRYRAGLLDSGRASDADAVSSISWRKFARAGWLSIRPYTAHQHGEGKDFLARCAARTPNRTCRSPRPSRASDDELAHFSKAGASRKKLVTLIRSRETAVGLCWVVAQLFDIASMC